MNKTKLSGKKKAFIIASCILLLLIIVALYTQVLRPLSVSKTYILIENFSADELDIRKDYYNKYADNNLIENNQFIRSENPFPSDSPDDYCHIAIFGVFNNRSVFKTMVGSSLITNPDNVQNVIYGTPSIVPTDVARFDSNISNDAIHLFLWRDGMTDEQVVDYLKKLDLKVFYENDISNSRQLKIPLNNLKKIDFDELGKLDEMYK